MPLHIIIDCQSNKDIMEWLYLNNTIPPKPMHKYRGSASIRIFFHVSDMSMVTMFCLKFNDQIIKTNLSEFKELKEMIL
jgi:hypothetical protein